MNEEIKIKLEFDSQLCESEILITYQLNNHFNFCGEFKTLWNERFM